MSKLGSKELGDAVVKAFVQALAVLALMSGALFTLHLVLKLVFFSAPSFGVIMGLALAQLTYYNYRHPGQVSWYWRSKENSDEIHSR
jgi:hypothetical protein